jgi:heavy metal efflux system protein
VIDRLINFALTQRMLTLAIVVGISCLGVWAVLHLPVDSFPDVSNVQVQIVTEPESMATEEVEALITFQVENAMNGLPNVTKIRSNSSFGLSVVTTIFSDDTDPYFARNLVLQRLNNLELPSETPKPYLSPLVSSFSNVFMYYLTAKNMDLTELRTIQDWVVARKLRSVSGVGNVVSYGGFVKQYQVLINPVKLRGYGLTIRDVIDALSKNNANAGGNFIESGGEEVIIRGLGRIRKISDIQNIVLKEVNGTPVKVGQIGEVIVGSAFRRGSASMNGTGEAVTGMVMTRKGVNTKAVVERVKEKFKEIQADLPPGVELHACYDQTELVDKTIDTVKEILFFSGGLVIIILTAVLMHIPTALIVSIIIPLSLLFSFVLMKFTGLSANLMTLGAVDFGVIVDAGVVMAENIFRHLSDPDKKTSTNRERLVAVRMSALEVGRPILFAIAIIIAVYLPLFTMEGIEGKMFQPLALTFIYALVGALLVSVTILPVLCYWLLKKKIVERHNPVLEWIRHKYIPILKASMAQPKKTIVCACVALVLSFSLFPFLGSEFIPSLDEGSLLLRTKLSPSVAHTESIRVASLVEKIIKKFPEVTVVLSRVGRSGMGSDLDGVDNADVYIGLKPRDQWVTTKNKEELVNLMAAELDKLPGLIYSFSQPIADMIDDLVAGIKADLGIKIFGEDIEKIDKIAAEVQHAVSKVRGAADLQREHILGLPQLKIQVDRDKIARYGMNTSDVQEMIESALAGKVVSEVVEGTRRFGLLVRYPKTYRDKIDDIQNMQLEAPDGARVPLSQLADIELHRGTVMINREDGQRRTAVLCNVRGRDLGSFVAEAQSEVDKHVQLPRGYRIVWGGQFENQQRAMARLSVVVPIVLLLIFFLLFSSFNSLPNAALVMLNVPFAMIGGIIALFISKQPLSVPAIIGFIALFGVAVQNGVILVSYIMQLQKRGFRTEEAVIDGALVRLRPVLMTAFVAIVGLIPKIISTSTGSEIQRPLATVVLGGLVSATLLTLIVLPTVYKLINEPKEESGGPLMTPHDDTGEHHLDLPVGTARRMGSEDAAESN